MDKILLKVKTNLKNPLKKIVRYSSVSPIYPFHHFLILDLLFPLGRQLPAERREAIAQTLTGVSSYARVNDAVCQSPEPLRERKRPGHAACAKSSQPNYNSSWKKNSDASFMKLMKTQRK